MLTYEYTEKQQRILEFNIKFITPLLIGGAYSREQADPAGLTGKALRGCWRFWFRAIVGGIVQDIHFKTLKNLEDQIFGSDDIEKGAKFRLNIEKLSDLKQKEFELGFIRSRKNGELFNPTKWGYPQNSTYSLKIIPRKNMSEIERNILISTIWIWGNLGAIGNRSRRGFGSPVIFLEKESNNPFLFTIDERHITLPVKKTVFNFPSSLEGHLQSGLDSLSNVFEYWLSQNNSIEKSKLKCDLSSNHATDTNHYFTLRSCAQILVATAGYSQLKDAIRAVHGSRNCRGMGWAAGNEKMASPVFIRFHKVCDQHRIEKFLPVVTWCKQANVPRSNPDCALNYLKNMEVDNQKLFVNYLSGVIL